MIPLTETKESRDFYVKELLRATGYDEKYLRDLHIKELVDLYEERVINGRGMV